MTTNTPRIYVAGHRGMVGSAIVRALKQRGQTNIVTRTHAELDLTNQAAVNAFFAQEKPDQVYLAAARVGGIHANNTYPAEFNCDNLMMQANTQPIEGHINVGYGTDVTIREAAKTRRSIKRPATPEYCYEYQEDGR